MEPISKFLERFKKVLVTAQGTEDSFRQAAELVIGVDIGFFSLTQKGNILMIRATPAAKNAILMKQDKILEEFKVRSGLSFSEIK